jgi:hypothetical protein
MQYAGDVADEVEELLFDKSAKIADVLGGGKLIPEEFVCLPSPNRKLIHEQQRGGSGREEKVFSSLDSPVTTVTNTLLRIHYTRGDGSKLLDLDRKPTRRAHVLLPRPIVHKLKRMLMRLLQPLDVQVRLGPLAQVVEPRLELLVLLGLLERLPPLELGVQRLGRAPLLVGEGEGLDLAPEVEHHVGVGRAVRVGFEQVREELLVFQLGWSGVSIDWR